jgi:hypothetical protein
MRITHTPFNTPTRAIGSDYALTAAMIGLLSPKLTTLQKIKRLFKLCKTQR